MDILSFLSNASSLILIVPLTIGAYRWNRLSSMQRNLVFLVILSILVQGITFYFHRLEQNNLWVYHLSVPIGFVLIMRIYNKEVRGAISFKVFNLLTVGFLVFAIVDSLFFQSLNTFNSNAITTSSIIYILCSLTYFYALLKRVSVPALEKLPMFWFNIGTLVYYSGTLVLFVLANKFLEKGDIAIRTSWALNVIFAILLTFSHIAALWLKDKE